MQHRHNHDHSIARTMIIYNLPGQYITDLDTVDGCQARFSHRGHFGD